MSEERKIFKLSDETLFQIRELVQLSMLTGEHIIDSMRQMRLEPKQDVEYELTLTPEYREYFTKVIDGFTKKLEDMMMAEKEQGKNHVEVEFSLEPRDENKRN